MQEFNYDLPIIDHSLAAVTIELPRPDDIVLRPNKAIKTIKLLECSVIAQVSNYFDKGEFTLNEKKEYLYRLAYSILNSKEINKGYIQ